MYISPELIDRAILREKSIFVLDLACVRSQYQMFENTMKECRVFYSVKTHPSKEVLSTLHAMGAGFEVVSLQEALFCLECGIAPDLLICSAPIKRKKDIERLYQMGVRTFVADSEEELKKIAEYAPESNVLIRMAFSSSSSLINLSTKFGLAEDALASLMTMAQSLPLIMKGFTFHVGGQCMDAAAWGKGLDYIHGLLDRYRPTFPTLHVVNMSGGFPATFTEEVSTLEEIRSHMTFRGDIRYWAEPGRVLVNTAGTMILPIAQSVQRGDKHFLYVDVSRYGALWILDRGFEYPLSSTKEPNSSCRYTVASLSCDGGDILWDEIVLPDGLGQGDALIVHNVGAYTLPIFNVAYAGVDPMEYVVSN